MKMTTSKPRAAIYSFLMYFLVIAELGILSGYRFVFPDPGGANGAAIGLTGLSSKNPVYDLAQVGREIGWNFVTASVLVIIAVLAYAFWLGFHRNWGGGGVLAIMNILPLVGLTNVGDNNVFAFFWCYGTSHLLPAMSILGLQTNGNMYEPASRVPQVLFVVVFFVLTVAAWIAGTRYRAWYAEKYEFDLSVPLQ
ncbi:MAG: hypothetical protein LBN97_09095 [Oscillospiraceae bacterium]|jgi:hypothetical protein|nr:hypothetical protein [Oscillospiraceae bacterium]